MKRRKYNEDTNSLSIKKLQHKMKIINENKRHPFPTTRSRMFYTNSSSSSSPGPTVYMLVHPTSTPVGLTEKCIICLAAAPASIDLMKGTIQQNNKRNTATTMPIIMPTLANHYKYFSSNSSYHVCIVHD